MATTTKERSTKKLSEQIYELMRKDIVECNLEPGELLEETVITDRYQIGRTPFREACHWLEAEGLLEIIPHRGCFVASFSNKDVNDLFELRLIVEPQVAELASVRSQAAKVGEKYFRSSARHEGEKAEYESEHQLEQYGVSRRSGQADPESGTARSH